MADAAAEDEGGEESEEEIFHIGPLMFGVRLRICVFVVRLFVGSMSAMGSKMLAAAGTLRSSGILMPCAGLAVRLIVRPSLKKRPGLATRRTSPQ